MFLHIVWRHTKLLWTLHVDTEIYFTSERVVYAVYDCFVGT